MSEADSLMDRFLVLSPTRSPASPKIISAASHATLSSLERYKPNKECGIQERMRSQHSRQPTFHSWTEQEDQILITQARQLGVRYKEIAKAFNGMRTADSCKRRLYLLKRKNRLPSDLNFSHAERSEAVPTSSSSTDKPLGVLFNQDKNAWFAKCNIAGKAVKKSFAVSIYGESIARQMAIAARAEMVRQKMEVEQAAPKRSNQYFKR